MHVQKQVEKEHYFKNYDSKKRWVSYWHQINETLNTNPKKVLEIGVGNKTVSNYLLQRNIDLTTVDIDPELNPDYVCSVTELANAFQENSFDTVLCAEVLEHLPFNDFEKCISNIHKVTNRYVVISLPYAGLKFGTSAHVRLPFKIKIPFIKYIRTIKKDFLIHVPLFSLEHQFDGEHYWEIGKKGYPLKSIMNIVSKYFVIRNFYAPYENPYHIFLVLEKD